VVPMLSGLLFSFQLNHRSDERLQAQLAVSNAVETIMAEGFDPDCYDEDASSGDSKFYHNRFPDVLIKITDDTSAAFGLKFTSASESDIFVDTYARPYGGA